jgi:hypothetical protein
VRYGTSSSRLVPTIATDIRDLALACIASTSGVVAVAHDDTVKYEKVRLPAGQSLDGWDVNRQGDRYTVTGTCPVCHGDAYGPDLESAQDAADTADSIQQLLAAPQPHVESHVILANCHCNHDHGKADATDCGRSWFVPLIPDGGSS